ncbi:MAG: hypothetical protein ACPG4T_17220 [Nannocystaceae bacterium]
MSLRANIDHLAAAKGIVSLAVLAQETTQHRGDAHWHPILDASLNLLSLTGEPSIRLVVGKHTLVIQRENAEVVGVAIPTGHAIAKSLRRMIRRMAKKPRPPLTKTDTAPHSTAQQPASSISAPLPAQPSSITSQAAPSPLVSQVAPSPLVSQISTTDS